MKAARTRGKGDNEVFFKILVLVIFVGVAQAKRKPVPCPHESDTVCIKCDCDEDTGMSKCTPMNQCPRPITSKANIVWKKGTDTCPNSRKYIAECIGCQCSGSGGDVCDICFALPARRIGQPDSVNRQLPQAIDTRLIEYQIDGWILPEI